MRGVSVEQSEQAGQGASEARRAGSDASRWQQQASAERREQRRTAQRATAQRREDEHQKSMHTTRKKHIKTSATVFIFNLKHSARSWCGLRPQLRNGKLRAARSSPWQRASPNLSRATHSSRPQDYACTMSRPKCASWSSAWKSSKQCRMLSVWMNSAFNTCKWSASAHHNTTPASSSWPYTPSSYRSVHHHPWVRKAPQS